MGALHHIFRRAACHDRNRVIIPRQGNIFEGITCGTDASKNGDLLNVLLNTCMPMKGRWPAETNEVSKYCRGCSSWVMSLMFSTEKMKMNGRIHGTT
jgi:hypothetical protein